MLNLSRLHLLGELALLGTISKVAEAANLTRPAVSQQLAILEQEIGTVLFERSGRGVKLTVAGENLVARAGKLFDMVNDIESELAEAKGAIAGEIRIAAFGSVATTLIPAMFERVLQEHPNLDLRFEELEPSEGLKAAASKQVDLALVDESVKAEAMANMLYFQPLCEDHFSVVISHKHRLAKDMAKMKSIEVSALVNENWALNRMAQTYKVHIVNACLAAGFTPRVVASCRNMAATIEMVRTGYVITVLPALALRNTETDGDFLVIPLRPLMLRKIYTAMAPGTFRRPAIAVALKALQETALTFY